MRIVVRLIFGTVTGLLFLLSQVGAGNAQQSPYQSTVGLKPSSGPAGSSFTISWNFSPCKGPISFTWEGTALTSVSAPSGQVGATVPSNATPGSHTVTGTCTNARTGQPLTGTATFRVTGTVTTAPPTTKVPPTTKPSVPVTTPTRPGTTTTPTTPVTTTTPPTTTPPSTTDTPPPPTDVPSTSTTPPGPNDLVLDRPSVQPGDALSATGKGCTPGERVTLTSDGERVGGAYADGTGAFTAAVEFTRIEAGRHTVVADCGVRLTGAVEQVVTSSSGGHSGTLVVLVFFVLAGITVIRFP